MTLGYEHPYARLASTKERIKDQRHCGVEVAQNVAVDNLNQAWNTGLNPGKKLRFCLPGFNMYNSKGFVPSNDTRFVWYVDSSQEWHE